ncbi:MAG: ABC transporter permease subunit [Clostridia bacterium]
MRNLLCANFARLWKNKAFWACMIFMAGFGLFSVGMRYRNAPAAPIDQIFFFQAVIIGLVSPLFCGLFLGTEYSDGTMRNKLIVGQKREKIYLSSFIVCTCSAVMMVASNYTAVALAGIPLLGGIEVPMAGFLFMTFTSLMLTVAFCALLTAIGTNVQNKPSSLIANILSVSLLFAVAILINSALNEPEYLIDYTRIISVDPIDGAQLATEPNPAYITGATRSIYQIFLDALPTGQAIQLSQMSAPNGLQLPFYSCIISIVSTIAGLWIYRKKDLK